MTDQAQTTNKAQTTGQTQAADHYQLDVLGHIRSPFKDKFGLPRQPGLIKHASAEIIMQPQYANPQAFEALADYSHIWLSFIFHQCANKPWKAQVRPPRLGGNRRVGVFASRAPFRPNNLGLSVVELISLKLDSKKCVLEIACPDLVDGTPIVDIKPYVAYADAIGDAISGFAPDAPDQSLEVSFADGVLADIERIDIANFAALIEEAVAYDPRPAYKGGADEKLYKLRLYDYEVHFRVQQNRALIETVALAGT